MEILNNINHVTESDLMSIVSLDKTIHFFDLSILPSGHGHYSISLTIYVDNNEIKLSTTTNCMPLIDAYKAQVYDGEIDEDYDNPTLSLIESCYDEERIEEKLEELSLEEE